MSINYSSILTKAWTITWKYKVLWIFGFLAMLGSGGSGFSYSGPQTRYNIGSTETRTTTSQVPPEWKNFVDQLSTVPVNTWINIAVGAVCCLLLLAVALWVLSIIGRGGLIGGIVKVDASGSIKFREAWGMGLHYFWRLLLIRLLRWVVGLLVGIVIILPGVILGVLTCGIGFIPLICGGIILGALIALWFLFMDYAVVVENLGIGEAVGRAWNILRDNIGPAVIFYLIQFAVSLGVGFVLLILVAPGSVMIFLSFLPLITQVGTLNVALLVTGLILLVLFALVSILLNSVYTTWQASVWTFAYQAFAGRQPTAMVAGANPPPAPVAAP
jgi:hypothetical protein